MKASELRGRAVVSLAEAQKVGEVDDIVFAPSHSQVVGFRLKHGLFSSAQFVQASDVKSVGPDAITIPSREVLRDHLSLPDAQPAPDLNTLSGIKVVAESGTLVGTVADVELDANALTMTAYYLGGSLWDHLTQGMKSFPAAPGVRFGGELMVIPDAVAQNLLAGTHPTAAADDAASQPAPTNPGSASGTPTT